MDNLLALGAEACFVAGDVGDLADAQALADAARERFGRVDALVLNAGIAGEAAPFWSCPSSSSTRSGARTCAVRGWCPARARSLLGADASTR